MVANERFLYTPDLPGPKGAKGDGLLLAFDPPQYEQVDETEIDGASRALAFRRLARGWVTLGKGWADETAPGRGRPDHPPRALRDPAHPGRRDRQDGHLRRPDGGHVAAHDAGGLRGHRRQRAGAEGDLGRRAADPAPAGRADRQTAHYPNLAVLSNDELKSKVESQVNQQFGIFYAIVGVAIFASLFGIVNTLTMSVIERTREIGVLRALGASRWQVRRSIADESLVIGLIGALLGIAVGTGLGYALLRGLSSGIPGVEYRPPFATMVAVGLAGVALGLIASVLPARRAARLDVIRAISYE